MTEFLTELTQVAERHNAEEIHRLRSHIAEAMLVVEAYREGKWQLTESERRLLDDLEYALTGNTQEPLQNPEDPPAENSGDRS